MPGQVFWVSHEQGERFLRRNPGEVGIAAYTDCLGTEVYALRRRRELCRSFSISSIAIALMFPYHRLDCD